MDYPNWHRRIQGAAASALGRWTLLAALVAILWMPAAGVCEVLDWITALVGLGVLRRGVAGGVRGRPCRPRAPGSASRRWSSSTWSACACCSGTPCWTRKRRQLTLVGAVAFAIHATCAAVACRWSFVVGTMPGERADDRAKAGETGRSLCALWVLLAVYENHLIKPFLTVESPFSAAGDLLFWRRQLAQMIDTECDRAIDADAISALVIEASESLGRKLLGPGLAAV